MLVLSYEKKFKNSSYIETEDFKYFIISSHEIHEATNSKKIVKKKNVFHL